MRRSSPPATSICKTFDRPAPDDEVFAFVNDLERPVGTYNVRAQLELLDERRFNSGVVHLHYRVVAVSI